jgi:CRP-like cAMP-binding protein
VATEASHLYALERQDFLEAVTGHSAVSDAAHRLAAERMSAAG